MRVKIEMVIDVDPTKWAEINGTGDGNGMPPSASIREDVRTFVFHAVQQLPMMEDTEADVTRSA